MCEPHLIIWGTVLALKDSIFWYKACGSCYFKLDQHHARCERCGFTVSCHRYRLVMEVDSSFGLLFISVFGNCLDQYFGKNCDGFCKKLCITDECSKTLDYSTSRKLIKCVEGRFIGNLFQFTIARNQNLELIENGLADKELTAVEMKDVGLEGQRSILEIFLNSHGSGTEHYSHRQTPSGCSPITSSAKTRLFNSFLDKCIMKPKLKRSLSDSFAFLRDSLVANLFQEYRVKNSQDHMDSAPFWKLPDRIDSVEQCCLTSGYKVQNSSCPSLHDKDSYFFLSVSQTSGIQKDEVAHYSYDILDVTLPILNRSRRQNRSNRFCPINATPVPLLRRCRSLTNDNSLLHHATETAGNSVYKNVREINENCKRLSYESATSVIPATQARSAFPLKNNRDNNCMFEEKLFFDDFLTSSTPKPLEKASNRTKCPQKQLANHSVDLFGSSESADEIQLHSRMMYSQSSPSKNYRSVFNNSTDMFV